MRFL
jgi:hypothetical protein